MSRDAFFFLAVVGEVTGPLAALHGAPWVGSRGPGVQGSRRPGPGVQAARSRGPGGQVQGSRQPGPGVQAARSRGPGSQVQEARQPGVTKSTLFVTRKKAIKI